MSLAYPMSPDAFSDAMKAIANRPDEETTHVDADALLVEVLMSLGYDDGCDTFSAMRKWYA